MACAAPLFSPFLKEIFEMSERCNNSACFSVEIKGTSDICVTFVVYACGKSILGVRTHEKDTADRRQRHLYMVPAKILTAPGLPGENGLHAERSEGRHPRGNASGMKPKGKGRTRPSGRRIGAARSGWIRWEKAIQRIRCWPS